MTFVYASWIPALVIALIVFSLILIRQEKGFFKWVKLYWFYDRSKSSVLSSIFFLISLVLFSIALLDIRGPEIRISMELPDQKTIILIDSSSSMLVEDVRPNRFQRGIFLARHFVRNAVGHQVSVVLFSDTTKRVVSFTSDIDLLDARLTGLEKIDITSGGSNISGAVHEAMGYFQESGESELVGNIVLITDGEENESSIEKELPGGVSLAVVGIGTAQGGFIPMRAQDGTFRGYRRYNNENVTSKLNEQWLKNFGGGHVNYKYWVAQSYSVPTTEILDFFASAYNKRMSEGEVRYRPVWGFPLIAMALMALILSSIFSLRKTFVKVGVLFALMILPCSHDLQAQAPEAQEGEPVMSETTKLLFEKMKEGFLVGEDKHILAQNLYLDGFVDESLGLYREIFATQEKSDFRESWKNFAFLLLVKRDYGRAAEEISALLESAVSEDERSQIRTNVLLILNQQSQQDGENKDQESKEEESEEKSGEENKDQNKNKSEGENSEQDQKQSDSSNGEQKSEEEKNSQENGEQQNQDEQEQDDQPGEEESDAENDPKEGEEEKPRNWDAKVKEMKDKLRTKEKVPAILKQIMDADREVQQEQLDTRTVEPSAGDKKDW